MNDFDPDIRATQGRGLRALAFATMPLAFADLALWIGFRALRGEDPLQGFGNVAALGLLLMVMIAWACHFAASRHQITASGMPVVLYLVFGFIVLVSLASVIAPVLAASLKCRGLACGDDAKSLVTMAIVCGVIAALASVNTIRFMLRPPLLRS